MMLMMAEARRYSNTAAAPLHFIKKEVQIVRELPVATVQARLGKFAALNAKLRDTNRDSQRAWFLAVLIVLTVLHTKLWQWQSGKH